MKSIKTLIVAVLAFTGSQLFAQAKYALATNYSVTINGGSNLHDWSEKVEKMGGIGQISWNDNGTFDINTLQVSVPVTSIKSTEGGVMNGKTYKALKSDSHPNIIFTLTSPIHAVANGGSVTATGTLTMAGISHPVTLQAKVIASPNGNITVDGSQPIKMTDYGIEPPTALFGAMKVSNDVTIHFRATFIKS